jgi:hypothetical protein
LACAIASFLFLPFFSENNNLLFCSRILRGNSADKFFLNHKALGMDTLLDFVNARFMPFYYASGASVFVGSFFDAGNTNAISKKKQDSTVSSCQLASPSLDMAASKTLL